MFANTFKLTAVLTVTLLAIGDSNAQFFQQHNSPYAGSISQASSTGSEQQLGLGALGFSRNVVNSQSETQSDGGYGNGGSTSIAHSRAGTHAVNLGGLKIGSSLTNSKTKTNGATSGGLSHDLNVGGLGFGSSLSTDNLHKGLGLQRSQEGGLQLGLGLLNLNLPQNQAKQQSNARTQAQAQAYGADAFATSNSNAATQSGQVGLLGFSNTQSQSNALSGTRYGESTASADGFAGASAANANSFGSNRRHILRNYEVAPRIFVRGRRSAQFIPFVYSSNNTGEPRKRYFGRLIFKRPNFGFPQNSNTFEFPPNQHANAEGLSNSKTYDDEQQSAAKSQVKQIINGLYQDNEASSISSNLAIDGTSGQLSSVNVNRNNAITKTGSQNPNNALSQDLNLEENQQQEANGNAVSKQMQTAGREQFEVHNGFQATNNNEFDSSSMADTDSQSSENGDTFGSPADSSSATIFQGHNGQNSAAQTNANIESVEGADGFVNNNGISNASAVSRRGRSANAISPASASSGFNRGNAATFREFAEFGGGQGYSGVYRDVAQAFKKQKRKSYAVNTTPRKEQQQQQNRSLEGIFKFTNNSFKLNWTKSNKQHYNHSLEQQQNIRSEKSRKSASNRNASTEELDVIDENERHGRTFTFFADLFKIFEKPSCVNPCTLDAYHHGRCCVVAPPVLPSTCCQQPSPASPSPPSPPPLSPPLPTVVLRPPLIILPPPLPLPTLNIPWIPSQCCNACTPYGYYGPAPCIRYTSVASPQLVTLHAA